MKLIDTDYAKCLVITPINEYVFIEDYEIFILNNKIRL